MITYKSPSVIGKKLRNCKHLVLIKKKQTENALGPCKNCGLCGCHCKRNKSTVPTAAQIETKHKTFPLKQNLPRANYAILVATCLICHQQYVGQTVNKFSTRWWFHWIIIVPRFSYEPTIAQCNVKISTGLYKVAVGQKIQI